MDHPELHTFPAAITSPDLGHYDEAIKAALQWVRKQDPTGPILVSVASMRALEASDLLTRLSKTKKVAFDTRNRGPRRGWNGPVVGVAVNNADLYSVPFQGATAACITPWGIEYGGPRKIDVDTGLRPWVIGTKAVGVEGPIRWSDLQESDPVFTDAEADLFESRTCFLNFANPLSSGYEKRDLVHALQALKKHSGLIDLQAAEAWAWSQGWAGRHITILREYADKVNQGKRIRLT